MRERYERVSKREEKERNERAAADFNTGTEQISHKKHTFSLLKLQQPLINTGTVYRLHLHIFCVKGSIFQYQYHKDFR
jgi:hypothetical protein